jgi:hypothetical protein
MTIWTTAGNADALRERITGNRMEERLKRYKFDYHDMEEDPNGDYVTYQDAATAIEKSARKAGGYDIVSSNLETVQDCPRCFKQVSIGVTKWSPDCNCRQGKITRDPTPEEIQEFMESVLAGKDCKARLTGEGYRLKSGKLLRMKRKN